MLVVKKITRRADYLRVQRSGKYVVCPTISIQWYNRADDSFSCDVAYGITVSGKVGNAVTRNRVKRRLRAAIAIVLQKTCTLLLASHKDLVIVARSGAATCDFNDLCSDIEKAIKKSLLLQN
ncbi:MAG: ribonuclease P protein component [Alphaproteobacteria bacterium]